MANPGKSPDNYTEYVEYIVPEQRIILVVLALTIGLGEALFPGVTVWFYNTLNEGLIHFLTVSVDEILFLAGLVLVHESIHYLAALKQGYRPQAGIRLYESFYFIKEPSPYVVVLDEHIPRNHNLVMLSAPLLIINATALVALLPIFPPQVTYYAKIALVVNTASSIQDQLITSTAA